MRLARRLWDSDQYFQAINAWGAVVGLDPANIDARLALAAAYDRTGQRADAAREYARILQLVPDQPEAKKAMAQLRGAAGG